MLGCGRSVDRSIGTVRRTARGNKNSDARQEKCPWPSPETYHALHAGKDVLGVLGRLLHALVFTNLFRRLCPNLRFRGVLRKNWRGVSWASNAEQLNGGHSSNLHAMKDGTQDQFSFNRADIYPMSEVIS